ncbi:queuosine precursor transporter [Salipaludibacillus sp. HK11]|uniref:queuosine precursor transporter n=1 Tax=Salipaludibacillus sp. HK11 TaxID=3394320 RepID=UPI0039FC56DC
MVTLTKQDKLILLAGIFFTALFVSNVVSTKLFSMGSIVLTAGILTYPLTFLISDSISEVFGKNTAKKVVLIGLFTNLLMLVFFFGAVHLPPAGFWEMQAEFEMILGAVPRVVAASLVAYFISQLFDVHLFDKLKQLTNGKHLWLRNNGSTLTSQLLDSAIFVTIAFAGTMPLGALLTMMVTQYLVKLVIALGDTPFIYLTVKWLKKETKVTEKEETSYVS